MLFRSGLYTNKIFDVIGYTFHYIRTYEKYNPEKLNNRNAGLRAGVKLVERP